MFEHKKNSFTLDMVKSLFSAYAESPVKGANYDLLDVISADLIPQTKNMDVFELRKILQSCHTLKYMNVTLLNSINRRLFELVNSPDSELNMIEGQVLFALGDQAENSENLENLDGGKDKNISKTGNIGD